MAASLIAITLISLTSFYFYKETYGFPWKHKEVKREAVDYMKKKYNMDVEVTGSSFNFKFDFYTAEVYDINDRDKRPIRIEKQRFYDENGQGKGERLEDNYSKVYWEKRLENEILEKYPEFYNLNDIKEINVDIAYFTTPMEEGVSSVKDENGVLIPLKPELNAVLDVDLKTKDFSESFLEELLLLIKGLFSTQMKVDLVVKGENEEVDVGNNTTKTKLINIEYDGFKDIHSVEDLKKVITDF